MFISFITSARARVLWGALGVLVGVTSCGQREAGRGPNERLIFALQDRSEAAALEALSTGAEGTARERAPAPFDPRGRGHTALYLATRIRSRRLIEALLDRGAEANERYEQGGTPLMQAVGLDNLPAAEALLERGADVRAQAADGNTALHYACLLPSDAMAKLLVTHQAPVNARNRAGETPLGLARIRRNAAVARYLQRAGGRS